MHNIWLVQALALAKVANGNNWVMLRSIENKMIFIHVVFALLLLRASSSNPQCVCAGALQ